MTRKDYLDIAWAIARAWEACENDAERAGVKACAESLAAMLCEYSTKFDTALFLRNCGIPE